MLTIPELAEKAHELQVAIHHPEALKPPTIIYRRGCTIEPQSPDEPTCANCGMQLFQPELTVRRCAVCKAKL